MKKCPYCAEEIQDEAIKCKHCGEMLSNRNDVTNKQGLEARLNNMERQFMNTLENVYQNPIGKIFLIIATILLCILLFIGTGHFGQKGAEDWLR